MTLTQNAVSALYLVETGRRLVVSLGTNGRAMSIRINAGIISVLLARGPTSPCAAKPARNPCGQVSHAVNEYPVLGLWHYLSPWKALFSNFGHMLESYPMTMFLPEALA
jgi:hypothetical protein